MTWVLALTAAALAGEARVITLDSGLVLPVDVLETLAGGFRVRVQQGTTYVPFDRLVDLRDGTAEPVPWTVLLVGPTDLADHVAEALALREGVQAMRASQGGPLTTAQVAACAGDLTCLSAAAPGAFVVGVEPRGADVWVTSHTPLASAPIRERLVAGDPDATWDALTSALNLELDALPVGWAPAWGALDAALRAAQPVVAPPPTAPPPAPRRDRSDLALAFVPVPGLVSLKRRDYAGFGGALATTAAVSTGWVFASGGLATRQGEHVALGLIGSYGTSVLSSALFATRGARAVATVAPSSDGATLVVMGALP